MKSRQPSLRQVEAAARIVRKFRTDGQQSLDAHPGRAKYRSRPTDRAEDRSQAERDRQARHVAKVYKAHQLEALLTRARERRFPITLTHIVRLATVKPASLRDRIAEQMIKSSMSRRELDQLIRLRCGKRGRGHSRKQIHSKEDAIYAIWQHCVAFESLWAGLHHAEEGGKAWWGQLAEQVRTQLTRIRRAVAELQEQLDGRP